MEEVVEFWNAHGRIGSRFELMKHSVERRLKERDIDRSELKPLSIEKAHKGAKLLAAACTLMHQSVIGVPDSLNTSEGVEAKQILADWSDVDCNILLSRPIFDEAIYGGVRFHHRSVREFLTAEWLSDRLKEFSSRQKIEGLFFKKQYDRIVIIPSLKPVLSWLVLMDDKIMRKVYEIEPEIILEGGDPSRLPLEMRKEILYAVCEKIALGTVSKTIDSSPSVQRFASKELADDIKVLWNKYKGYDEVIFYFLRLIGQARMEQLIPEVVSIASDPLKEKWGRTTAIRTLRAIDSYGNFIDLSQQFLKESEALDREVVAEFIDHMDDSEQTIEWITTALQRSNERRQEHSDGLSFSLSRIIGRSTAGFAGKLVKALNPLLCEQPFIEKRGGNLSSRNGWLMSICIEAVEKLIIDHHPDALEEECLFVLAVTPIFSSFGDFDMPILKHDLRKLVSQWPEFNHRLFWKTVKEVREQEKRNEKRLTHFYMIAMSRPYWSFDKSNFEQALHDMSNQALPDDQLIGLSIAFHLYVENKRPKGWLAKLKAAAKSELLKDGLNMCLHPAPQSAEVKRMKRQHSQWARRSKQRQLKEAEEHKKSVKWLREHCRELRKDEVPPDHLSSAEYYLLRELQRHNKNTSARWTSGNWKDLVAVYGIEVATAFRDGMIKFWRNYKPALCSEFDKENKTPIAIIFGLSGIDIESKEVKNWAETLSETEAEIACRYAVHELNDFPEWLPLLFKRFPQLISEILLKEIYWELDHPLVKPNIRLHVLHKVAYTSIWSWDMLVPGLFKRLATGEVDTDSLLDILSIVNGSSITDQQLADFITSNRSTLLSGGNAAYWYATWIGIDPDTAIPAFAGYLSRFFKVNQADAKNVALAVSIRLNGGRRSFQYSRTRFKTAYHIKSLLSIFYQYADDEEKGATRKSVMRSSTLIDDARHARSILFNTLVEMQGKESYLVIMELVAFNTLNFNVGRLKKIAKEKAERDADSSAWEAKKFLEFSEFLESTPSTHRELFYLAAQRLRDLKYDLEEGDDSIAATLAKEGMEREIRKFIAGWCRDRSHGRYTVAQEEELADARKPDCRFLSSVFDGPVPVELKLADNWTGNSLFERLENQLCGDYLRDVRSGHGLFVLVYRGEKKSWEIPDHLKQVTFDELVQGLQAHWENIASRFPTIDRIDVIGIDLTKRNDKRLRA